MIPLRHLKIMMVLSFMIALFTLPALVSGAAPAGPVHSLAQQGDDKTSIFWNSKQIMDTGKAEPLYSKYNIWSSYKLDYPEQTVIEDQSWLLVKASRYLSGGKSIAGDMSANIQETMDKFFNSVASGIFKLNILINYLTVTVLQISMSGTILTWLLDIFGSLAKIIGILLFTRNLFYIAMLTLGIYLIWKGLIQRKLGTTISETLISVLLLGFAVFFVNDPSAIVRSLNTHTDAIGAWIMQITSVDTKEINQADGGTGTVTDKQYSQNTIEDLKNKAVIEISDKIWGMQVRGPWAILQFGELDINLADPTQYNGNVVVSPKEYDNMVAVLEHNKEDLGDGWSSKNASEYLKQMNIGSGTPWAEIMLNLDDGDPIRQTAINILGSQQLQDDGANGFEYKFTTHPKAAKALPDIGTKFMSVIMLLIVSVAMCFFITLISVSLIMAQLIVLISMVIGPVVLMLSALPQIGHKYIKNWGMIILGAFTTKILLFTTISVMFAIISTILTVFYDPHSVLSQSEIDKNPLLSSLGKNGNGVPLALVQLLILVILIGMNKLKDKMFQNNKSGAFGVSGALLNNMAKGNFKGTGQIYSDALQDRPYGHRLDSSDTSTLQQQYIGNANPLNWKLQRKKDGAGAGGNAGTQYDPQYANISNFGALGANQYLSCPKDGTPCTNPRAGFDPSVPCPKGHKTCPLHDQNDKAFNGQMMGQIRNGADKFRPTAGANTAGGTAQTLDSGLEVDNNMPGGGQISGADTMPCPVDKAPCVDMALAKGQKSGQNVCSAKNCICPFRNQANTEFYGKADQQHRASTPAASSTRIPTQDQNHADTSGQPKPNSEGLNEQEQLAKEADEQGYLDKVTDVQYDAETKRTKYMIDRYYENGNVGGGVLLERDDEKWMTPELLEKAKTVGIDRNEFVNAIDNTRKNKDSTPTNSDDHDFDSSPRPTKISFNKKDDE